MIMANTIQVVQGPEELASTLREIKQRAAADPQFALEKHVIPYRVGNLDATVTEHTSQTPIRVEYFDPKMRPAPMPVKEMIAKFFWDECGERDRYLQEHEQSADPAEDFERFKNSNNFKELYLDVSREQLYNSKYNFVKEAATGRLGFFAQGAVTKVSEIENDHTKDPIFKK